VAFAFGAAALGGFLVGAILTGQLMAVFLANTGAAWDNAKKKIEDGLFGGKGTDCHKAAVIGDTVGDPFKDTAGPAIKPMIKVMNLVGILVAPLAIRDISGGGAAPDLSDLLGHSVGLCGVFKARFHRREGVVPWRGGVEVTSGWEQVAETMIASPNAAPLACPTRLVGSTPP